MPVLEKLKEDIISSSPPSYIAVDGHLKDNIPNGCVVVDHDQENNTNSNYENLSKLTKSNSSATKLGFKKKMSGINLKHKLDDPFRFAGDGVDFKAKLIGFQDVDEPRGDQMCQDAIQACKAIVKRKGEHKQRIFFNISLEGLKIKEQNSAKVLYTFPVSKVSFIAKDVSDNRAFGFVYGTAEDKHKFYGIKTEKTADHVVFSIRDMFQIVYEMKKKQIELAKQQQQQKPQDDGTTIPTNENDNNNKQVNGCAADEVPVANLLDLETELENLEQGMQHMEKWTSLVEDSTENGLSQSPSSPPSGLTSDSSGWATTSLSSNALNESNDPFNDHMFTSSTNSFGSAGPHPKEPFVPPPPVSSNSRRASHPNGHSTLFGSIHDPFLTNEDAFENGFSSTQTNLNASNIFLISKPSSDTSDPFDTSHVANTIMHQPRNGSNLLDVKTGAMPLIVSTPLQGKSSGVSWIPNGHSSSLLLDSSQCLSAIPPPNSGYEEVSANGNSAFSIFNGSSSVSKVDNSSLFNNAAVDSGLFQTSNGVLHDSSSTSEFTTMMTNGVGRNGHQGASPLSIPNSSGSQSPRSPPTSLSRSLTKNGGVVHTVDDAFAKLCNLDTLVITPSRSPQQQTNGFAAYVNELPLQQRNTPPKRDDPFAHLKNRPKKTINELRELTAGPSLEGFESLLTTTTGGETRENNNNNNESSSSSSPTSRPPIPPRSGQNFPAIPRPDVVLARNNNLNNNNNNNSFDLHQSNYHHQQRVVLLPPPVNGAKFLETTMTKHDPFADEFFA